MHQVGFMHPKCEMLQENPIHWGQGHGATPARLKSAIFTSDIAIFSFTRPKKKKKKFKSSALSSPCNFELPEAHVGDNPVASPHEAPWK